MSSTTFMLEGWADYDLAAVSDCPDLDTSSLFPVVVSDHRRPEVVARELYTSGVRRLKLVDPEIVRGTGEQWLWWVALLGHLSTLGIVVDWNLDWTNIDDPLRLVHLPPPRNLPSTGGVDFAELWQQSWRLFVLIERRGPGFLLVHDNWRGLIIDGGVSGAK